MNGAAPPRGRIMMKRIVTVAFLLAGAACAAAGPVSVAVTVYNDNLGLVRENRVIALEKGESIYSFQDVAARIDPTSVHLKAVDNGELEVVEQNYEYDLLSPDKLYDRYIDKEVKLFLEDGGIIAGTLLSHGGGRMIVRNDESSALSVVRSDKLRNVDLAGGLDRFVTRPTLVWTVRNGGEKTRTVEVEYLTAGMSWHAEYVALADEKNESIDLAGWVSVENRSGAVYRDAKLKLMAGTVHRAPPVAPGPAYQVETMMKRGGRCVEERSLFEYHIYDVGRSTTLRDNQVKQIAFVPSTTVPVRKEYLFEAGRNGDNVQVILEFVNDEAGGLGIPLPAGVVRVFQDDGRGGSEFIGEDRIDHTPKNEKVRLVVGEAFDLVGERKVLAEKRITSRVREQDVEIRLRNRKEEAVEIKVVEAMIGDWTIEHSSHDFTKESARKAEWTVSVPPDGETVITYTVRSRW